MFCEYQFSKDVMLQKSLENSLKLNFVNMLPRTYLQGQDAPVRWALAWLKNNILVETRSVTFLEAFFWQAIFPSEAPNLVTLRGKAQYILPLH